MAQVKSLIINGKDIIDLIYPVGSFYMSTESAPPQELFGGTWEQIKGRFLWGVDDTDDPGSVGGEKTHTLTINEMPTHSHEPDGWVQVMSPGGDTGSLGVNGTKTGSYRDYADKQIYRTSSVGGGQPHNNMPPFYATYIWHRTA